MPEEDLNIIVMCPCPNQEPNRVPVQAAEAEVVQEARTVPGEDPGIYACDYKKLARIQAATAAGRLALLNGDFSGAEVCATGPPLFVRYSSAGCG